MVNRIYLWEIGDTLLNNPLENTNYLNILGLLPTLWVEIKKRVIDLLSQKYNIIQKECLNPNSLKNDQNLQRAKIQLIQNLFELEKLTWNSKSITVFWDDCFTNTLMLKMISKILWENNFEKFVSVRDVDFSKPYHDETFEVYPNTLLVFWWSLHDTYNIDDSYYNWNFAETIKKLWDNFDVAHTNNRAIWVCFWQQYFANLLWIQNKHSSSIIATYRGLAQFWPSNCSIQNYKYISKIYQEALSWISDFWWSEEFSTFFTRTWYVDFDLLKTGHDSLVIPLIKDEITGSIVWWWTKNWNMLWVQFHPEISYFDDRWFLQDNIESILPYISQYKNYEKLIENFNFGTGFEKIIEKDIWEYFYTYALLAFIRSIKNKYISTHKTIKTLGKTKENIHYQASLKELTKLVRRKVDSLLATSNPSINDNKERLTFLKKIDESGRLLLNSKLDWKVNRGINDVSKVLGFNNIWEVLIAHIDFIKEYNSECKVYIFRDWGAWDGSLLKDLYSQYKWKDILFYWVWDYIYFDIFPSLKLKWIELWIPEDIIVLLFEQFLLNYSKFDNGNIHSKVKIALEKTKIDYNQKIHKSSITWEKTAMFSKQWEYNVWDNSIEYIKNSYEKVEQLKKYIVDNFYSLFEWYFERIYISKFNDFNLNISNISKVDFQLAIRSTSHVDDREYMKIIFDYINNSANPWSIYIDNWVHRSYTWAPRLNELFQVSKMRNDVQFSLIYDENTNYFTWVIIQKLPYHDDTFFVNKLKNGYKVVSLEEACDSTFFKLEYFIRNFIVNNFKNYDVFWDFNKEILSALKQIMDLLKNNHTSDIKNIILGLINYIATNFKSGNIVYDLIKLSVLEKYSIWEVSLEQIVSWKIYIPDWMDLNAKRMY